MIRLGVSLDALLALREVAGGRVPDLLAAVHAVRLGGADYVVLRATAARRPTTERDVRWLVEAGVLPLHLTIEPEAALVAWAIEARPAGVVLAGPATAAGGLDVASRADETAKAVAELGAAGIPVAVATDADEQALVAAMGAGAEAALVRTVRFAAAATEDARVDAHGKLVRACATARALGMRVRAGGGLDETGVERVAALSDVEAVEVGRALVARAAFDGLARATEAFARRARRVPAEGEAAPAEDAT